MNGGIDIFVFPRLDEHGQIKGITCSKTEELPQGDFTISEYVWPDGLSLCFVEDHNFTASEREFCYRQHLKEIAENN